MSVPQISIIMPVHNTPAEYLKECLDSVFAQTFPGFELICVDDASDHEMTKALIDVYQNQHENMRVIRLEHGSGAAAARNTGFLYAESEYVIFLDADDIFGKNFLSEMYQCIEENQADLCACGFTIFHDDGQGKESIGRKLEKEKVFNKNSDTWLMSASGVPWNKLCRRRFLSEHNIYFQSLSSCNDLFFSCMCMICAKSVCVLEKEDLIFYRCGTKCQISANRNPVNLYKAMALLLEIAPRYYGGDKLLVWSGAFLILEMVGELSGSSDSEKRKELYLSVKKFFKENKMSFENRILEAYKNNILQADYESKRYDGSDSFLWQIRLFSEEIKSSVAGYRNLYVWGRGKRGDAFEQFCKEEGIILSGITDIEDRDIGGITEYGNRIFATGEILEKETGLIVASNRKIYGYLKERAGCPLLDLEEFCPM